MESLIWILVLVLSAMFGWLIWHNLRKLRERQRAEEARFAKFMADGAGVSPPTAPAASLSQRAAAVVAAEAPRARGPAGPPAPTEDGLGLQKLLFDAAHKAGEAGEPALAIQLYARLLARYPETGFAQAARSAVQQQKTRLSRPGRA